MFPHIKHSFTAKLNLYILFSVTLILVGTFFIFYYYASLYVEKEAYAKIRNVAERTNLRVAHLLHSVEKIPDNMNWMLTDYVKNPDHIFDITRKIVQNNDEIFGCAIAFEPYFFPEKGKYFSPYSYMKGDSVITVLINSEHYDYLSKNWYRITKESNIPSWSRPFHDFSSDEIMTTSYSVPLYNDTHQFIGVFSIDVAINSIKNMIDENLPYPNSYCIVISRKGNYIVRTKANKLFQDKENIFESSAVRRDSALKRIVHKIVKGETGKDLFNEAHTPSYIFYAPISGTAWSMAVICPYEDIFVGLHRFNLILFLSFFLVLALIYFISTTMIRKITAPLKKFALSARTIANGDFTVPLPFIQSKDEMRELHDSFIYMQQQLTHYIHNLQKTTVDKEKIESELRIAHNIQMEMLPQNFSLFENRKEIDLYATLYPARHVGGDLYDFQIIGDDLYFTIGDVCGKGVPASLVMAMTISLLRTLCSKHYSPAYIANFLNNSIGEYTQSDMFITFFIGRLNLNNGQLKYCNAGHTPPIMTTPNRSVSFFDMHADIPLGVLKDHNYTEYDYTFTSGSGILLYTDGATDLENPKGQFYGKDKLLEIVRHKRELRPREFISEILSELRQHNAECEQTDDITLLTLVYGEEWNRKEKPKET